MNRYRLALLALAASLAAPSRTLAQGASIPLGKGDVVELDASRLPEAYTGTAKATCKGSRVTAVGPEVAICELTVPFAAPAGAARLAYVFRGAPPADGEISIDVPFMREERPRTFVAPSAGTLVPPAPAKFAAEEIERAASEAAARQCGECKGGTGFALERVEVVQAPSSPGGAAIAVRVRRAAPPADGAARR